MSYTCGECGFGITSVPFYALGFAIKREDGKVAVSDIAKNVCSTELSKVRPVLKPFPDDLPTGLAVVVTEWMGRLGGSGGTVQSSSPTWPERDIGFMNLGVAESFFPNCYLSLAGNTRWAEETKTGYEPAEWAQEIYERLTRK